MIPLLRCSGSQPQPPDTLCLLSADAQDQLTSWEPLVRQGIDLRVHSGTDGLGVPVKTPLVEQCSHTVACPVL